MLSKSWEQIPFSTGVNNLMENKTTTELPFAVSCGTQQGIRHFENSVGNQDALSLVISQKCIIAVVCDGCTNSSIDTVNEFTSNQVGANILSKKLASILHTIIVQGGVKSIQKDMQSVTTELTASLEIFINQLSHDTFEKQLLINNFFTSTILAVAIDSENYCVFNFGDGLAYVNNVKKDLLFKPGVYLSSLLENTFPIDASLNIVAADYVHNLDAVFISTDGFDNEKITSNQHFLNYLNQKCFSEHKGYIDGLPEFRKVFLAHFVNEKEVFDQWPGDDASFVFIRRLTDKPEHFDSDVKTQQAFPFPDDHADAIIIETLKMIESAEDKSNRSKIGSRSKSSKKKACRKKKSFKQKK